MRISGGGSKLKLSTITEHKLIPSVLKNLNHNRHSLTGESYRQSMNSVEPCGNKTSAWLTQTYNLSLHSHMMHTERHMFIVNVARVLSRWESCYCM